jgi:hypothetical protein
LIDVIGEVKEIDFKCYCLNQAHRSDLARLCVPGVSRFTRQINSKAENVDFLTFSQFVAIMSSEFSLRNIEMILEM